MEDCMCIYMCERSLCSMRKCSDGDFKTVINNSLQLHSAVVASRGKSTDLGLLRQSLRVYCNLPFLICQSLITARFQVDGSSHSSSQIWKNWKATHISLRPNIGWAIYLNDVWPLHIYLSKSSSSHPGIEADKSRIRTRAHYHWRWNFVLNDLLISYYVRGLLREFHPESSGRMSKLSLVKGQCKKFRSQLFSSLYHILGANYHSPLHCTME